MLQFHWAPNGQPGLSQCGRGQADSSIQSRWDVMSTLTVATCNHLKLFFNHSNLLETTSLDLVRPSLRSSQIDIHQHMTAHVPSWSESAWIDGQNVACSAPMSNFRIFQEAKASAAAAGVSSAVANASTQPPATCQVFAWISCSADQDVTVVSKCTACRGNDRKAAACWEINPDKSQIKKPKKSSCTWAMFLFWYL